MTLWAILSDIHGRGDMLRRVLADADERGATGTLCLGDVGHGAALDLLIERETTCIFGNWEASGLRGMDRPYRGLVARWPAWYRADGLWAAHASPIWPEGLTITGVVEYLRQRGLHWLALYPSLYRSEEARWAALAELEASGATAFFHGHTHIQEAWRWQPDATLGRLEGAEFAIEPDGSRYLIGVGSVGDPHDGDGACYALYDDIARRVAWRRVEGR
jgi:predicted phosphodiesterase